MDKSRLGARRPVRNWGIKAPRNSLKTPENSRKLPKKFPDPEAGHPASQRVPRAQQSNSETPVKKLRFLPFLFSTHQVYAPGAPGKFLCNLRNKIPVFCQKNFEKHLDLLPGEGIYTRPGYKSVS